MSAGKHFVGKRSVMELGGIFASVLVMLSVKPIVVNSRCACAEICPYFMQQLSFVFIVIHMCVVRMRKALMVFCGLLVLYQFY